jgi:hypothetical protein
METLLNRYRNITVLLLVIFAQLVLIAVQVRNDRDVRMVAYGPLPPSRRWRACWRPSAAGPRASSRTIFDARRARG